MKKLLLSFAIIALALWSYAQVPIEFGKLTNVSTNWQTVSLSNTYTDMVVVATPNYTSSNVPMVARIGNITANTFDIKIYNPDDPTSTTTTCDIYYIVVEAGQYTEASHGVKFEAGTINSSITCKKGSWGNTTQINPLNSYSNPVVFGQMMETSDMTWGAFWACDGNQGNPPDNARIEIGIHVGEDNVPNPDDKEIGYIIFEAGSDEFLANGGKNIKFVADVGGDNIEGYDKPKYYTFSGGFLAEAEAAILSAAGMDGGDGGWPILYGANPITTSSIYLTFDEDQVGDSERNHTTEQVAYIVLDSEVTFTTYYSQGDLDPAQTSSWNTAPNGSGTEPINFTAGNQKFVIQSGDEMTTTGAGWTVSGANSSIDVANGGKLIVANGSEVDGDADFSLLTGATLEIKNPSGISSDGSFGSIQVAGTISFATDANYIYSASSGQNIGSGLPDIVNNFTVNSTNFVQLSKSVTTNGTIDLQQGELRINGNTLTINGALARTGAGTGTITASATSDLNITGSGTFDEFYFTNASESIDNLTINRTGANITLSSDLTIHGILTLTDGIITNAANEILINNTDVGAVSGGNANSYIEGSLQRKLESSISSDGTNYSFPVGENGNYRPLDFVDIWTSATEPIVKVAVSTNGTPVAGSGMTDPIGPRNWYTELISGDYIISNIQLTEDGLSFQNTIGQSANQSGIYDAIGSPSLGGTIVSSDRVTYSAGTSVNYYAIGVSLIRTWYSYQTGNWNETSTWTLDPSGTLQIGTATPGNGDFVVILPGRTVSLTSDKTAILDITIQEGGFLNMADYRFTNGLTALRGQGTLKLASPNFPNAATNTFVDAGGGTTEYDNTSNFTLPLTQSIYNNLTINTSTAVATQLNNLILNGDLRVKSGTFRINDDASNAKRELTVYGDVTIDSNGKIAVGQGATNGAIGGIGGSAPFLNYYRNFHSVVIHGDFSNSGEVKFTNLPYPIYDEFPPSSNGATAGAASVYFRGASHNTISCNGTSIFYNLIVDKGTDQTYTLTLNSTDYENFKLFGANSLAPDGGSADNPNIRKALWIRNGTLILRGSVVIPSLTEGTAANSEYIIPFNGALMLDGVDATVLVTADDYREINAAYNVAAPDDGTIGITKNANSKLTLYGKLQIDNGYVSTRESAGIVTSTTASGQLIINGGTLDSKQLLAPNGSAAYIQTGGVFCLRGRFQRVPTAFTSVSDLTDISLATLNTTRATNGVNSNYGTFNLDNPTNIFSMSGGTIRIYDVCGTAGGEQEAFDVKSMEANNNVTGGTLEIIPVTGSGTDPSNYRINTTAAIGDLTVKRESGSAVVQLNNNPITILDDFTITSGAFNANGLNVSIGGDCTFESGITYTHGNNVTIFNGAGNQDFTVNTGSALALYDFTIQKAAGDTLNFAGTQTQINVTNDFRLEHGTLNDNVNSVNIAGDIYNSGIHYGDGKIVLNGTDPQSIDGDGIFGNVELNNTDSDPAPVSLNDNMTVNGTLTFSQDKLFNLSTSNLTLGELASLVNAGTNRYFITDGNVGDGGLTKEFAATGSFTFPVGVDNYTPATLTLNSAPTTYGSITVIPVNYAHPNVTASGRSLDYFWRVKSSGFDLGTATITHSYTYHSSDVVTGGNVSEDGYVAARFLGTSWTKGTTNDVNTTTKVIGEPAPSGSFLDNVGFIDGDYTAGDDAPTNPFGTPTIYYSRRTGQWSNTNTWSLTSHTVNDPPPDFPKANDIVIIGGQDSVYLGTHNTTANTNVRNCASLQIEVGSALDIGYNPDCIFTMVLSHPNGNGNFRLTTSYNSGSTFQFPSGDFSEFNVNVGTTELYTTNPLAGTTYWLPNGITSYGNLIISPLGGSNIIFPNNDLTVYGDLITRGQNADSWFCPTWNTNYPTAPTGRVPKTMTVFGDLLIQGGTLTWYGNGGIRQDIVVYGDVVVYPLAAIDVWSGATNQSLSIGGSLINNTTNSTATPYNSRDWCDFRLLPLIFFGDDPAFITNTGTTPATGSNPRTEFEYITVNKGNSPDATLTFNLGGSVTFHRDNNWFTLQNGTFRYMPANPNYHFVITTSSAFTIPATAGLHIDYTNANNRNVLIGNSSSNTNDLYLNGELTIINGNVYIGRTNGTDNRNNDIEYSGAGTAAIDIRGGLLRVNGQIRRPTNTTNGALRYSQSGGQLFINGQNHEPAYAKLEVLNPNSSFTMSGGEIYIVRGGGTNYGDLFLRPETSNVTGGEIIFTQTPDVGPVVDEAQDYKIDANFYLNNLTVSGKTSGTDRNATLGLMVTPLQLNGNLYLANSASILNTNNRNVTIKGNLNNNGTYNFGTNLTTFIGTTQQILGSSVSDFYDLYVNPNSSLTVSNSFTVNNDLTINSGNLALSNHKLTLLGDLVNNSSYTDDNSTGEICFQGTEEQQITGSGAYGRLELNNALGVNVNSDITLQGNLVLTLGCLNINSNLLTLSQNSVIEGTPFGITKMIISDGVTSSQGLRKFFTAAPQNFTFPVGITGKYTPANYTISANGSVGYINVNPINNNHPTVLDPDNVLHYYWEIESAGISGFSGNLELQYMPADVHGNENEYVAAHLDIFNAFWFKAFPGAGTDNVDEDNDLITFNSNNSNDITGDYTAGNDEAIPLDVPVYRSIKDDVSWTDQTAWTPVGHSIPCPAGGPNGFIVIIDSEINIDQNYCFAYRTTIDDRLKIISPTYGHNLGGVDGNGTLYLESGNLPAGDYTTFIDCAGDGTLEYGGTGDYTIIASQFSSVPNMFFTGTGTRTLPNKDLTICKRLVIDGATLDNATNNKKLTILGTMERYNSGAFLAGTGEVPEATVSFSGTSAMQTIGGTLGDFTGSNAFHNFEINNPFGLNIGTGGTIEVSNKLLLTEGKINTSTSNTLNLSNLSADVIVPQGGTSTSYINGPLTKRIVNGESFLFPLGKGDVKGHEFTLTSAAGSTQDWSVEYFTPNPTSASIASPLKKINRLEYWSITTTALYNGKVKIGWDAQSDLTAVMPAGGMDDMRIAQYNSGSSEWEMVGTSETAVTSGTIYVGDVTSSTEVAIGTTPENFTVASENSLRPVASFSSPEPVCGTAGIPITVTTFEPITLNYTLDYTINGTPQPTITISSVPYTLPTSTPGIYQLTGFTYNNDTETGGVDNSTVEVYAIPQAAEAGDNQTLCALSGTTLEGNSEAPYDGLWTIESGAGGILIDNTDPETIFTGVLGQNYTLKWTISNNACSTSDQVQVTFPVTAKIPSNFTQGLPVVCQEMDDVSYSVPNVSGITYHWSYTGTGATLPGTTGNSIDIDFGASATSGTLGVIAENVCGTSPQRTMDITVHPRGEWLGTVNSDWDNPDNWSCFGLPLNSSDVDIPASASNMPVISTTDVVCRNLNIESGASLEITASGSLDVFGDLTNNGAFSSDAAGTVSFKGTTTISGSQVSDFGTIYVSGTLTAPNGNMNISGDWYNTGTFNHNNGTLTFNGTGTQTITAPDATETLNELIINSGSDVAIASSTRITMLGEITINGGFTLNSDATNTASFIDNGTINGSGNVTVKRYILQKKWHYISSPMVNISNKVITENLNCYAYNRNLMSYNESFDSEDWNDGWIWPFYTPNDGELETAKGYAAYIDYSCDNVILFSGTASQLTTGNQSIAVTNKDDTENQSEDPPVMPKRGWNLIGNPYPSIISATDFLTANSGVIDGAVYFWDEMGGSGFNVDGRDYAAWNHAGSVGTTGEGGGSVIPDGYISVGQSFFVHKTSSSPTSGTVVFNNGMRTNDQSAHFFKSGDEMQRLKLSLSNSENIYNEILIALTDRATDDYDPMYDAYKMNGNQHLALYSMLDDAALMIQSVAAFQGEDKIIPVGLKSTNPGTHTFEVSLIENMDMLVYLEDTELDTRVNLNAQSSYEFETTESVQINDRFIIRFTENTPPEALGKISDQSVLQDEQFSIQFETNYFTESDEGDQIEYEARQAGNAPLPDWLVFNPETLTLTGTPANKDVADYTIELVAKDLPGAEATLSFNLHVENVNEPPVLYSTKTYEFVMTDNAYSEFTIPNDIFTDPDPDETLTYDLQSVDENPLPDWLYFDADNNLIYGTPDIQRDSSFNAIVTVTDSGNESASATIIITIENVNDAPVAVFGIENQTVKTDQEFSLTIPEGLFTDPDKDDELAIEIASALPDWLEFDQTNLTLSGTPAFEDINVFSVEIQASDLEQLKASSTFTITVIEKNKAPNLAYEMETITIETDHLLSIDLQNAFTDDAPLSELTYKVTLDYGAPLPDWLSFDANTLQISGTPAKEQIGQISLRVAAFDIEGLMCDVIFDVNVVLYKHEPQLNMPLSDYYGLVNQNVQFSIPQNTFIDPEPTDVLVYTASLSDGSALPEWLVFDAENRTFSATPVSTDTLAIRITATDTEGDQVSDYFYFYVDQNTGIELDIAGKCKLYPNPCAGVCFVKTDAVYNVIVRDGLAKTVYEKQITPNDSNLDLSHLENGIYAIQFKNEKVRFVKKIVIIR